MITVNNTAKTLDEGIKNMMSGAKDDYKKWSTNAQGEQSQCLRIFNFISFESNLDLYLTGTFL